MKYPFTLIVFLCLVFLSPAGTASADNTTDNTTGNAIYAALLKKQVVNAHVDYDGFKADEKELDKYLAFLSNTDIGALSRTGQFAFYINAYNAFTIKLILTQYPGINSIKEIGSFFTNPWQKKFIPLRGKTVTLDYIEHDILRPQFKDPRVHFAVNCASKSCPPLRNEPYEAELLEQQLNDQTRQFINDPKSNYVKDNTLFLSRIFKWFKEDFADDPARFVRQYADAPLKEAIRSAGPDIKTAHLPYDWSLNR